MSTQYEFLCNNCGKKGHPFYQCKTPITSFGVIAFRINMQGNYEFLMIRRKDTLGYIDFLRGKYTIHDSHYIMNMMKQMTVYEKERIRTKEFLELWYDLWGGNEEISDLYRAEKNSSKDKFDTLRQGTVMHKQVYTLNRLLDESGYGNTNSESPTASRHEIFAISDEKTEPSISNTSEYHFPKYNDGKWMEPEWGFPKGRRNTNESDFDCAVREFSEETGYNIKQLTYIQNILPFEEIFSGSNYKSYKHKYYLMHIDYNQSLSLSTFQNSEVSKISWKTFDECIACIRPYNLEKIRVITNVNECLLHCKLF
jgi:8-oxo-dGTP pyrophosphatase MutT (NUDIX family)